MDKKTWDSLSDDSKKTWDQLSDADKTKILGYAAGRAEKKGKSMKANIH